MTHLCCIPTRQCQPCEHHITPDDLTCYVHRYDIPDRLFACITHPYFSRFVKGILDYWNHQKNISPHFSQQEKERATAYVQHLPTKQTHSVRYWVYHNHVGMNQWLSRYGHHLHHPKTMYIPPKDLSKVSSMCSILQKTILSSPPLQTNQIVYKGMMKETMEGLIQFEKNTKLLTWTGFVATSLDQETSQSFKGGHCCESRIFVPKGSHVLYYPMKGEKEMLLPAFSVFYSMKDDPMSENNDWIYLGVRHEMTSLPIYTPTQLQRMMDNDVL